LVTSERSRVVGGLDPGVDRQEAELGPDPGGVDDANPRFGEWSIGGIRCQRLAVGDVQLSCCDGCVVRKVARPAAIPTARKARSKACPTSAWCIGSRSARC
jgi:hypothetical protein